MAIRAAQHQPGLAAGDAKHFMTFGMVVMVAINPVSPLRRPAIGAEGFLKQRSWVAALNGYSGLQLN
jgi:hypothetical protein